MRAGTINRPGKARTIERIATGYWIPFLRQPTTKIPIRSFTALVPWKRISTKVFIFYLCLHKRLPFSFRTFSLNGPSKDTFTEQPGAWMQPRTKEHRCEIPKTDSAPCWPSEQFDFSSLISHNANGAGGGGKINVLKWKTISGATRVHVTKPLRSVLFKTESMWFFHCILLLFRRYYYLQKEGNRHPGESKRIKCNSSPNWSVRSLQTTNQPRVSEQEAQQHMLSLANVLTLNPVRPIAEWHIKVTSYSSFFAHEQKNRNEKLSADNGPTLACGKNAMKKWAVLKTVFCNLLHLMVRMRDFQLGARVGWSSRR